LTNRIGDFPDRNKLGSGNGAENTCEAKFVKGCPPCQEEIN
jgi:hypothetical protein